MLHDGAYIFDFSQNVFAKSELLSKLTGMICIVIAYKRAPKYPLPLPLNDTTAVYNHFLNYLKVPSSDIVFVGDGSGGGLALLTLLQLSRSGIVLPSVALFCSPWCYLNVDANDEFNEKRLNYQYDASLVRPVTNIAAKMAMGKMNENLRPIRSKLTKLMNDASIFNPILNNFKGLKDVKMYFCVGASEALLFDTLDVCQKAYMDGCMDIICDVYPFMFHGWTCHVGKFPEATYTVVKMADFIMRNKKRQNIFPRCKYEPDPGQLISV